MEELDVDGVSIMLRGNGLPEELIRTFRDNYIDGASLIALPQDFEEFRHLIPQSGLRIKVKGIIEKYASKYTLDSGSNQRQYEFEDTSVSATCAHIASAMDVLDSSPGLHWNEDSDLHCSTSDNHLKRPASSDSTAAEQPPPKRPDLDRQTSEPGVSPPLPNSKTPATVVAKVNNLRLPIPCPVPNTFTPKVKMAIEQGKLIGNAKIRLMREAALFYNGLCPLPTSTEYITMAQTLCEEYPQLKDKRPTNGEHWSSVKSYLSQRFRNQRRSSEPLQAKGKTSKLITSAHATPVAASLKPQDTEGADDDPVAYERNNAALVAEVKRPQPRINTMKRLLELTCKGRRGIINSSTSKTTELLEQFPFFKDKRMVHAEFLLMCGEDSIETISSNWKKYSPLLAGTDPPTADEETQSLEALKALDKELRPSGPGSKQPAVFSFYELGMSLDAVLREKVFAEPRLVVFGVEGSTKDTQGFIVAEREVLFEVNSYSTLEGIISLIAAYYVFYEALLQHPDTTTRKTAKYTSLINSILD